MVAGEASGDLLAGLLLDGLRARWPELDGRRHRRPADGRRRASTPGGRTTSSRCAATSRCCGTSARSSASATSCSERLLDEQPDVFIGVDAPDFNLDLEVKLRAAGIKTVHFVSPSIWAWRGKRIEKIAQGRRPRAVHLPVRARAATPSARSTPTYVGHPLAERHSARAGPGGGARRRSASARDETLVALLPGSRRSEIQYIAPRLLRSRGRDAAAAPGAALRRLPVVTGLRARGRAAAPPARARRADRAARRPLARRAGGLRRRSRRQRHRDARSGAVQAADGRSSTRCTR